VLYDPEGRRQIYCDLKDIQETAYPFSPADLDGIDLVVACNINFNRALLPLAKASGKTIATDVHVLSDIHDPYNREFMEAADILFLSDEAIGEYYAGFLQTLAATYPSKIIVLGRGSKGAAIYLRADGSITELPAVYAGQVVNTVGAGDALFSGFLHFYAKGFAPADALQRAQVFAAHKITVSGASNGFVNEQTVEAWVR
jgi:ribokinase